MNQITRWAYEMDGTMNPTEKKLRHAVRYLLDHTTEEARNTFLARISQSPVLKDGYFVTYTWISNTPAYCLVGLCIPDDLINDVIDESRLPRSIRHYILLPRAWEIKMEQNFDDAFIELGEDATLRIIQDEVIIYTGQPV